MGRYVIRITLISFSFNKMALATLRWQEPCPLKGAVV